MRKQIVVILWTLTLSGSVFSQNVTWKTVSVPGICTYQIPPSVELQKGTYKKLNDQFGKMILETDKSSNVTAQPKGINNFDPAALKLYCRIIFDTEKGRQGDYAKLDEPMALSESQLKILDRALREPIEQAVAQYASKGIKFKLLSWQPLTITRVNGVDALLSVYSRSANDAPAVLVYTYRIENNDYLHTITISYRESERALWADDLGKAIETFKFKKR